MKKSVLGLLVVLGLIATFNACQDEAFGTSNTAINKEVIAYIPEDAGMVMSMNLQNLMDKAGFEDVKEMSFYADMLEELEEEKPELVYIFEDPTNSGIDLSKNGYIYMDTNEDGSFDNAFGGLMLSIGDKAKFEEMLKKGDAEVINSNGFSYVEIRDDSYFAWNGEMAFLGGGQANDPTAALDRVFNQKDGSISKNNSFSSAQSGKHDISIWMNTESFGEALYEESGQAFALAEISKEAITDNTFHTYVDFEDGEIVATSEYDLNKELLQELKIIFKKEVKTDFSPYLPNEDLTMLVTGGIDFRGLNQLLKERTGASFMDMAINEMGVDRDDIAKAFDGDAVVAVYGGNVDNPRGIVGLKIGDKAAFQKVMDNAIEQELFEDMEDGTYSLFEYDGNEAKFMIKDDIVFISNYSSLLADLQAGKVKKSDRISAEKLDGITGGFMGMFMDFASLSNTLGDDMNMDAIESITSSSNWTKSKSIIKMKDGKENALRQMMQEVDKQYRKDNEK